jgi:hypothetical protein
MILDVKHPCLQILYGSVESYLRVFGSPFLCIAPRLLILIVWSGIGSEYHFVSLKVSILFIFS